MHGFEYALSLEQTVPGSTTLLSGNVAVEFLIMTSLAAKAAGRSGRYNSTSVDRVLSPR